MKPALTIDAQGTMVVHFVPLVTSSLMSTADILDKELVKLGYIDGI